MDKLPRMPINLRVAAAFFAVGAIWGSAWIPTQALSRSLPSLPAGALRFALAAMVLAIPAVVLRLRSSARPVASLLLPAVLLGATMLALPYACTAWAAGRVSPGLVALAFALMPLCVLLFGREEGGGGVTVVVLGIGGVSMIVAPGISLGARQLPGVAALLAAMGLGGFSLFHVRRLYAAGRLRVHDLPGFCAIQFAVASVILTGLLAMARPQSALPHDATAAGPLALLAIVVSAATLPLLYWLLGRVPAWQAATLQWMSTWIAVCEAAFLTGLRPNPEAWLGAALVPGSILCILSAGRRSEALAGVTLEITDPTATLRNASHSRKDGE